jgi:NAD(P)-dependent dehydrogenase (short-subunit alcohol dehydrogenase family)
MKSRPRWSTPGISKLALVGLTTTLARQLGRERIAINAIAPGNTSSDAGKLLQRLERERGLRTYEC